MIKKRLKLISDGVKYHKKIAMRFHDTRYYEAQGDDIQNFEFRESQKALLNTPMTAMVLEKIKEYRGFGKKKTENCNITLRAIYKKNARHMLGGIEPPVHEKIINLVSKVPLLVEAYSKIKSNKGAMTEAAAISPEIWNTLDPEQKSYINATVTTPDGISMQTFIETSRLLKKGTYPWGSSRRIYIPKLGDDTKLRPLTIPPFMDRVVQQVIRNILEAIYEPWFDKANVSFGFRPNKGTHDAIVALKTKGIALFTALEGDIEAAYDHVDKNKLVQILSKRIKDKKFLKLMKERLNYNFFDIEKMTYIIPDFGVPQGGVDSPYLFNIYIKEFDDWITSHLEKITNKHQEILNKKSKEPLNKPYKSLSNKIHKIRLQILKNNKIENNRDILFKLIKIKKVLRYKTLKMQKTDNNLTLKRFCYVRYADDWIILTNTSLKICQELKETIKKWLFENLKATLCDKTTNITKMKKTAAHFLGFELKATNSKNFGVKKIPKKTKFTKKDGTISYRIDRSVDKTTNWQLGTYIDKQRQFDRNYIKGYCDKYGIPREIGRLSSLEPFVIIERYNSVIRGFSNFYTEFIENPSDINRWVYILRYSCFKTLCQKYKLSISKLYKKYQYKNRSYVQNYGKTIFFTVKIKYKNEGWTKRWKLLTYLETKKSSLRMNRYSNLLNIFLSLEKLTNFHKKKKITEKNRQILLNSYLDLQKTVSGCHVKDRDYNEAIKWIN
jgi:retron-type reverse transcriptase